MLFNEQEEIEEGEINTKVRVSTQGSPSKKSDQIVKKITPMKQGADKPVKDTKSKVQFDAAVQEADVYMNREEEDESLQQRGRKMTQSVKV